MWSFRTLGVALLQLRRANWLMTGAVLALTCVGVSFVYSSCYVDGNGGVPAMATRQFRWALMGLGCYVGFSVVPYQALRPLIWWGYAATLVLLVLVLLIGTEKYGARRWLDLMIFEIQPSELAKLATVLALAERLNRPRHEVRTFRALLVCIALVAVPTLLVVRQPDLGTALVFIPTAFAMLYAGGIKLRYLTPILGVAAVAVTLILGCLLLPEKLGASPELQQRFRNATMLENHQVDRIVVFFYPDRDPRGRGWNKLQSEIAVGSGGLTGKGFLKGTANILGFLPRSVAPTDFIFSVIAEELGFVGSAAVLGLYLLLLVCGMVTALGASERAGRLIAVGLMAMLYSHVFVNIAMTVGLMPITGLPLPLLSYGGTFMVVTMASLGIVQSVHIHARRPEGYRAPMGVVA
jgi:rod shape determining protein RodA